MLHTKFCGNRPAGSGEEDFFGRGVILGHVTSIMSSDFHFLIPERFYTKLDSDQHISFLENPV